MTILGSRFETLHKKLKITWLISALLFIACTTLPSGAALAATAAQNNANTSTTSNTTNTSAETSCALTKPTGSSASTYTYNKKTGLWENQYYTWNPKTCVTTPIKPVTYTYDYTTGMWNASVWQFIAAKQIYVLTPVSVQQPPTGSILVTPPKPIPQTSTTNTSNIATSGSSSAPINQSPTSNTQQNTNNVNQSSGNTTNTSNSSSINSNSANTNTVNNSLNSQSDTGNAVATTNTSVGNIATGSALTIANVMNLLNSASSLSNPTTTFVDNIPGNVTGNLIVDPSQVVQPASSSNNLTVNTQNNGQITNNLNLDATSGSANVSKNTQAGSVTTGNADAVANVVNMINSMIASKQSFVGVINILGDLNGNILMPTQFLNGLIASNAPSTTIVIPANSNISSTLNNNQNINNIVTTNAQSGLADVSQNTTSGNTTTGNSATKVTIFNLTGEQVVTSNTLLVFVNVLGHWVGMLMDAPAGATAAAYGQNITQNTVQPTVPSTTNTNQSTNNNQSITNNITENATSGSANVSQNTKVGPVTTGNAEAAANLLNINNSNLSAANWFGILFINVFGNWTGNFGVQPPVIVPTNPQQQGGSGLPYSNPLPTTLSPSTKNSSNQSRVSPTHFTTVIGSGTSQNTNTANLDSTNARLTSVIVPKTTETIPKKSAVTSRAVAKNEKNHNIEIGIIVTSIGVGLFVIERGATYISRRKKATTNAS